MIWDTAVSKGMLSWLSQMVIISNDIVRIGNEAIFYSSLLIGIVFWMM